MGKRWKQERKMGIESKEKQGQEEITTENEKWAEASKEKKKNNVEKKGEQAKRSKSDRSPQSSFLVCKNRDLTLLSAGDVCESVTMVFYEVRARNWPIGAGDKPQWFSHFLVSKPLYSEKKKNKRTS